MVSLFPIPVFSSVTTNCHDASRPLAITYIVIRFGFVLASRFFVGAKNQKGAKRCQQDPVRCTYW